MRALGTASHACESGDRMQTTPAFPGSCPGCEVHTGFYGAYMALQVRWERVCVCACVHVCCARASRHAHVAGAATNFLSALLAYVQYSVDNGALARCASACRARCPEGRHATRQVARSRHSPRGTCLKVGLRSRTCTRLDSRGCVRAGRGGGPGGCRCWRSQSNAV